MRKIRPLTRSDAITDAERPWVELVVAGGPRAAREQLLERGLSPSVAAAIAFWLLDQAEGRRAIPAPTCSRYRTVLTDVEPPSPIMSVAAA